MNVGQKVIATEDIFEYPSGDSPGGYCCKRGDELFIRALNGSKLWPYSVSHEGRLDCSFSVSADEIKEAL